MRRLMKFIGITVFLPLFVQIIAESNLTYADTNLPEVEKILGVKGQIQEDAFIVRFPRSDIKVMVDGEPIPTALGFTSWIAWKSMGKDTMVMGDIVLLEKEINPVISALAEVDIDVTALHNHFLNEQPRIMFMHIDGMGATKALARGIRNALNNTATPKSSSTAASVPAESHAS